jgi:photosystem II stability/assembly factor-like uncharacterized protein
MTLRGDIRDYFEREAAAFPAPAGLRPSVTSEAARGRLVEPRGMRLAAVVAVALAVAIVAGLFFVGPLRRSTPPLPAIKAGQQGMGLAADAVDQSHGWALLGQCPANGGASDLCSYWVETTNDGGQRWTDAVRVGSYPMTNGDAPRHIHFGDNHNGFVYGNGVAFATHDGGRTWTRAFASANEIVTIVGRGTVWAVVYPCGKGTQCAYDVNESVDGGRTWTKASPLPAGLNPRMAAAFGAAGLIVSGFGTGDMAVTRDGGRTWTPVTGHCAASDLAPVVATPDGSEIWEFCAGSAGTKNDDALFHSGDGGRTWLFLGRLGMTTTGPQLYAPSRGKALLLTSTAINVGSTLFIWQPGATGWGAVAAPGELTTLSFAPGMAWAVDNQFVIWTDPDGSGETWSRLPAQP